MNFKSLLIISLIVLLLIFPFTACAGTGSVKVIDKDGNDITDKNHEEGDSNKPHASDSSDEETKDTLYKSTVSNVDAASAAVETGLINTAFTFADYFLEDGLSFQSVSIEDQQVTGSKTITYSVNTKELNPFQYEFVRETFYQSGGFYYISALALIGIAYCAFVWQRTKPVQFSNMRESLTGKEAFFDFNKMLGSWSIVVGWPPVAILAGAGIIQLRNIIVFGMSVSIVTVMGASSVSLPTYFITNATWYFNLIQRSIASYGVILIIMLVFVIGVIIALMDIFHSRKLAIDATKFVFIEFCLLVFVDVLTVFFMWVGVNSAVSTSDELYSLAAMLTAFAFDSLIILALPIYILSKIGAGTKIIAFVGL